MVSSAQATPPDGSSVDDPARRSCVSSSAALHANVLALNRNFLAVQVISVKRAFCLVFKGLAEVIHVEEGRYCAYDFEGWRELGELKAALGEKADYEDWIRA